MEQALELLGEVDFIVAKGRLSRQMQGTAPQFASRPELRLLGARHPLLAAAVPIDICLGPEDRTWSLRGQIQVAKRRPQDGGFAGIDGPVRAPYPGAG